jgi:hypothetical protein
MNLTNSNDFLFPIIAGTLLFVCLASFLILFIRIYYQSRVRFKVEREILENNLLEVEIEIKEQTLNAVSRELHDNLGQIASLIKINLNLVSTNINEHDRSKILESIDLLKQLIADIKSLSLSLNSDNIHRIGLFESIKQDIERINRTGTLQIKFTSQNTLPALAPDVEIFLYRICQEAWNNILKHAKATNATLLLSFKSGVLEIDINDNGLGFDNEAQQINGEQGSGLSNIRKRCEIIGASFSIESKPGAGTKICINLPIKENPHEA